MLNENEIDVNKRYLPYSLSKKSLRSGKASLSPFLFLTPITVAYTFDFGSNGS